MNSSKRNHGTVKIPITQKLIIMITTITLLVNGLLAYVIKDVMRESLTLTEHKYLAEIVKNIGNTSQLTVQEFVGICEVLAKNTSLISVLRESSLENPMNTHPNAEIVAKELTDIMNSYEGHIMSMAIFQVETDAMLLNTGEMSDESFSFQTRPYYAPVNTKKYIVTEPYLDILTKGLVVTIGSPVIENGEVLGVVGLDLPIDFLSHLVMESSYGDSGRSLVLDNRDIIIAYADPSFINQPFSSLEIIGTDLEAELKNPSGQLIKYEINGDIRLGIVSHNEELDWTIVTGMDYSEFDTISQYIVILLIFSVAVTLLVCSQVINGKLSETIFQLNNVDALTGLYNRSGFSYHLDQILLENPSTMGLISVNANGLKFINDTYGTEEGDKHIKNTAKQLKENFSFEIFRMAGDEFIGLAPNVNKEEFESQLQAFHTKMNYEENFDFAVGHAWSQGKIDLTKLTFEADAVMYINKQKYYGRSGRKFDQITDSLLSQLLTSLEEEEFMIYLQPQVHLSDGSLYGAEALIRRFDKKEEKMVFPDEFIPSYEQNSIIRHVDLFVVETVCNLLKQWLTIGKTIPISVNLSRVTLQEYGIVDTIVEICDRYQVPHPLLVIEVTERVGLVENNVASTLISSFKEHGFHISLDDFGCAYSNIVTLAQIEVDEVKIDKSLVDDLTTSHKNHVLVKNVLSMCNELEGASTLAEGIEDESQAKILHELGCHIGQGYHYSRPIPVPEFYEKYIKPQSIS